MSNQLRSPLKLAIRSEANLHLAFIHESLELCEQALTGFDHLELIVGSNLNTATYRLWALTCEITLARRDGLAAKEQQLLVKADRLERQLADQFREAPEANFCRWHYLRTKGDSESAWETVRQLGKHDGTWAFFIAVDRLCSSLPLKQALRDFDRSIKHRDSKYTRAARAYLAYGLPEEQSYVEETVALLNKESPFLRKHALYIQCLLGELDQVESGAQILLSSGLREAMFQVLGEEDCLKSLADSRYEERLLQNAATSNVKRSAARFTLAMRRIAEGNRTAAEQQLRECLQTPYKVFMPQLLVQGLIDRL